MNMPASCPYKEAVSPEPTVSEAPGPKGMPIVGSMFAFRSRPLAFLEFLGREYGDVVSYRVGHRNILLFLNPDHIKEVLAFQHAGFTKWGTMKFLRAFLGSGLLTSEGELHSKQRRLCQPLFFRPELAGYVPTIVDHALEHSESWREGDQIDTAAEMRSRTILILTELLFGGAIRGHAEALGTALTEMMTLYPKYRPLLPLPASFRFRAARRTLDDVVSHITREHRKQPSANKFCAIMDQARSQGLSVDERQVRDEMVTFLFAGHETTTHALTWAWYLLARHPQVEQMLHEELDSVLCGRPPQWDDVPKLRVTRGVFLEALRLFPPVWIMGRRALTEMAIGGYRVPEKSIIVLSPYITQRDERWFKEPLAFDPSRWFPENETARPKFSFIAFSAGPRQCVGEPLARLEGLLLLAVLAQRWQLRPTFDGELIPQPTATLRPQQKVTMRLARRTIPA